MLRRVAAGKRTSGRCSAQIAPELSVSVFFVLSGFLMVYSSSNKSIECTLKKNVRFAWTKIKKLYPLHILTMFCLILASVITIMIKGTDIKSIIGLLVNITLNTTLLQSWVPVIAINTSLNGVAWYLSAMVFLYFMFPIILRCIRNINNSLKLTVISILILGIQLIYALITENIQGIDGKFFIWTTYIFPVFRLGDFIIGCNLGYVYLHKGNIKSDISIKMATAYEGICLAIVIAMTYWISGYHTGILRAFCNRTTLYIPLAAVLIIIFSMKKGAVTKFLSNSVFIFLRNISSYVFLIHYVVTQYVNLSLRYKDIVLEGSLKAGLIICEFILTIILCVLYKKLQNIAFSLRKSGL